MAVSVPLWRLKQYCRMLSKLLFSRCVVRRVLRTLSRIFPGTSRREIGRKLVTSCRDLSGLGMRTMVADLKREGK